MSPCVVEFVLSDSVSPSFKGDDLLQGIICECWLMTAAVVLLGYPYVYRLFLLAAASGQCHAILIAFRWRREMS